MNIFKRNGIISLFLGAMVMSGAVLMAASAHAQITFELDRSEPEYPFLGNYVLETPSGERCTLKLTDKMRLFEGFRVEADKNCPKPFHKAQAWILKPSGPTIQILGKWDHIIWNGSDADADGRFAGLSSTNKPFTLVSKNRPQPRVIADKKWGEKWEGVWVVKESKQDAVICAVALLYDNPLLDQRPAVVDPECIAQMPRLRQLKDVMYWSDRFLGGTSVTLLDRYGAIVTQFSPFSGPVYVGNVAGKRGKVRTYDWIKARPLSDVIPSADTIPGGYDLMPADQKSSCFINLSSKPDAIGQDASMPIQDCFMTFEISSWALIENRLTFFDNFREQTLSLRQVFPDYWIGTNTAGLTVTLGRRPKELNP